MLFNTLAFLLFFPLVCIVYYLINNNNLRTWFLLIASFWFYSNLSPYYTLILLGSIIVTYFSGILIDTSNSERKKKLFVFLAIIINVCILLYFKYTNFLVSILNDIVCAFGWGGTKEQFNIILPIGISFYIFKTISYISDVYKGKIVAEKDFHLLSLYISFFPQLLAGPIERAGNMLTQFNEKVKFDGYNITSGLKMMLWGYFLKLVFADRAIIYVDAIYSNLDNHNGTSILLASVLYSFQIYCDFAGYSLLSIGVAKSMGYNVMNNFNRPYLAVSVTDFWHRWHISLSTWLKDYVYIPLGGSRCSKIRNYWNIFITFLVSGIWHGANWTYIVWGCLHGILQIIEKAMGQQKCKYGWFGKSVKIAVTFCLINLAWMFFRLPSVNDTMYAIKKIFTSYGMPFVGRDATPALEYCALGLLFLIIKDVLDEFFPNRFHFFDNDSIIVRYASYIFICLLILAAGVFDNSQFIYMQF